MKLLQEPMMGSCQYFIDAFEGNTHSAKLLTINNDPNILNISLQELDNATWINTTNMWKIIVILLFIPLINGLLWLPQQRGGTREKHQYRALLKTKGSQRDDLL